MLGLLLHLKGRFDVRSNRESGHGRYDVMVLPKQAGKPGVVLELKVLNVRRSEEPTNAKVEKALDAALEQMQDRKYAAELHERGAEPIQEIAMAFHGKRVWVRSRQAITAGRSHGNPKGSGGKRR